MELKLTKMKMDCYSNQLMLQLVNTPAGTSTTECSMSSI